MGTYHRWTTEEDELIKQYIKNSPTNIKEALEKVAKKLNVSFISVNKHYYNSIQKRKDKVFLTVSSKKAATNYKVTRKGKKATKYQPEKTKKSKWKRILAILAE